MKKSCLKIERTLKKDYVKGTGCRCTLPITCVGRRRASGRDRKRGGLKKCLEASDVALDGPPSPGNRQALLCLLIGWLRYSGE